MMTHSQSAPDDSMTAFDAASITRPDETLLKYYLVTSAMTLIAFPFVFIPLYLKYHSLRYKFDDEGISMRWGMLFRQEVNLTYRRIQDIHVSRGLVQRWLGLSSVAIQTASGSAGAEMTIVGIKNPEALRDFLYTRMRGVDAPAEQSAEDSGADASNSSIDSAQNNTNADEALQMLHEIRDELQRIGGNKS